MSQTPDYESTSPRAGMQLWYCTACTRLINPPGSEGIPGPDGERYCPKCHGAKFSAAAARAPVSAETNKKGSRAVIVAAKSNPEVPSRSSHATPAARAERAASEKPGLSPAVAFALGGAAIFMVAGLMYGFSGKEDDSNIARKDPVENTTSAQKEVEPSASRPSSTKSATSPAAKALEKGATNVAETRPNAGPASTTAPVTDASRQPPATQSSPTPTAPATVAVPVTPPPVAQAAAPGADLKVDEFQKDMARAKEQIESQRFSLALETLKNTREKYTPAPWFAEQGKAVAASEQHIQDALSEFTTEVDDARNRVAKLESLSQLDSLAAEWTARIKKLGGTGLTSDAVWLRMDPHEVKTNGGTVLTRQTDGSFVASGNVPERDTYTFTSRVWNQNITALRAEALVGPNGFAGRAENGNIALAKVRLFARNDGSSDAPREIKLTHCSFDYGQANNNPAQLLDDDPGSHWAFIEKAREPHALVIHPAGLNEFGALLELSVILEFQSPHARHTMSRVRVSYSTRSPAPTANDANALAVPAEVSAIDPLAMKPLDQLMRRIAERRAQLAEAAQIKQIADIGQQIDLVERQVKSKTARVDVIHKALEGIEATLPDAPPSQALLERIVGLRFDAETAKEAELSVFDASTRQMGSGAELLYDFSSFDQYMAWTPDLPDGGGGAWYDAKAGHIKMQVLLRRNWDGDDRRSTPVVRMPFLFDPNNWVFEAAVNLIEDKKLNGKTQIGILVWDGGKYSARLAIREHSAKDVGMQLAHNTPNHNLWSRVQPVKGGIRDTYTLNMTCINGQLACSARTQSGAVVPLPVNKEKIGFEPKFFGFFLRSEDDGENAIGSFDNARFTGQPLRDKLKETYAANRVNYIARYKTEYARKRALPALELAEREGRIGAGWDQLWDGVFIGNTRGTFGRGGHHGRNNVFQTHPAAVGVPFTWRRKINLEAGKNWTLRFDIHGGQDSVISVRVNDQEIHNRVISGGWQSVEIPLAKYAGSPVQLDVQHHCGGTNHWSDEHAYWDNLRITSQ